MKSQRPQRYGDQDRIYNIFECLKKRNSVATCLGPTIGNLAPISPDRNWPENWEMGVKYRLLADVPEPVGRFSRMLRSTSRRVAMSFPALDFVMSPFDFIMGRPYTLGRKLELLAILFEITGDIHASYEDTVRAALALFTDRNYLKCCSFIKAEFYDGWKYPRIINSRSDAFKVVFGPFVEAVCGEVYCAEWMVKNIKVCDFGKYLSGYFSDWSGQFGCSDHTSFEACLKPTMFFNTEFQLYKWMAHKLPYYKELMRLILPLGKLQRLESILGTAGVFARMSGEMSTSLGNGFVNHVGLQSMAIYLGWTNFKDVVEGDDGVFTAIDQRLTNEVAALFGFNLKQEIHDNLGSCGFCQLYFVDDEPMRDFRPILVEFPWSQSALRNAPGCQGGLLKAKTLSLLYELPGCPVVRSYALMMYRRCCHCRARYQDPEAYWTRQIMQEDYGTDTLSKLWDRLSAPIPKLRRDKYFELFGLSSDVQMEYESYFDRDQFPPKIDQLCYTDEYAMSYLLYVKPS